jgi:hypothetical protein
MFKNEDEMEKDDGIWNGLSAHQTENGERYFI